MNENKELQLKYDMADDLIKQRILIIRGQKVMLDVDLADLYGVKTKRFNEQVKRNSNRFPGDFIFQLTSKEKEEVVANCDHLQKLKFSHNLPYAFTEHGVAMLSAVLNSKQAITMSIFIVRAFIKMRESLDQYNNLVIKIGEIEVNQINDHKVLEELYFEIKQLTDRPIKQKEKIGFVEKE